MSERLATFDQRAVREVRSVSGWVKRCGARSQSRSPWAEDSILSRSRKPFRDRIADHLCDTVYTGFVNASPNLSESISPCRFAKPFRRARCAARPPEVLRWPGLH